ncbi:MAG TPA: hypothetical protein DHW72_12335 [Marinobacter hydrocarbonoclasticus]|nr:hypothetical protein [Marinobacter nauticus]
MASDIFGRGFLNLLLILGCRFQDFPTHVGGANGRVRLFKTVEGQGRPETSPQGCACRRVLKSLTRPFVTCAEVWLYYC